MKPTAMSAVMASVRHDGWNVDRLGEDRIREMMVKELVEWQKAMYTRKEVLWGVATANHQRSREAASRGVLPLLHIGDYV